ncbi:unnamed protein product [Arctia plantaginis]|uniref:Uncharacterized protein n=1 Tax=Arctia plantaginis TaxID=874455 RepID=A0A8S0ZPC8_ARCPL|nr:unnamed protein product [Arctia plantaginis]
MRCALTLGSTTAQAPPRSSAPGGTYKGPAAQLGAGRHVQRYCVCRYLASGSAYISMRCALTLGSTTAQAPPRSSAPGGTYKGPAAQLGAGRHVQRYCVCRYLASGSAYISMRCALTLGSTTAQAPPRSSAPGGTYKGPAAQLGAGRHVQRYCVCRYLASGSAYISMRCALTLGSTTAQAPPRSSAPGGTYKGPAAQLGAGRHVQRYCVCRYLASGSAYISMRCALTLGSTTAQAPPRSSAPGGTYKGPAAQLGAGRHVQRYCVCRYLASGSAYISMRCALTLGSTTAQAPPRSSAPGGTYKGPAAQLGAGRHVQRYCVCRYLASGSAYISMRCALTLGSTTAQAPPRSSAPGGTYKGPAAQLGAGRHVQRYCVCRYLASGSAYISMRCALTLGSTTAQAPPRSSAPGGTYKGPAAQLGAGRHVQRYCVCRYLASGSAYISMRCALTLGSTTAQAPPRSSAPGGTYKGIACVVTWRRGQRTSPCAAR